MQLKRYGIEKERNRQLILSSVGIMLGCFVVLVRKEVCRDILDYLNISNLIQSAFLQITIKKYFIYLVKNRFFLILLLFLVTLTPAKNILLDSFVMLFGIGIGTIAFSLFSQYQMKGFLILLAIMLPQWLIYLPMFSRWIFFFREKNNRNGKNRKQNFYRNGNTEKLLVGLRLCLVTIIGIVLECYVNPKIIQIILKNI